MNSKDICGHTKVSRLEMGYGYGATSGWSGLRITYRCPRCCECLWFQDDEQSNFPREITNNDKKRKENLKWKPKKKVGPHPFKHINYNKIFKEIGVPIICKEKII